MKSSLLFFAFAISAALYALDITADFPIVTTTAKGTPEQKAPEVLQEHLEKTFNHKIAVISEEKWEKGTSAILLQPDDTLDQEEWNIKSDGKVLTISGGWPRGLFYGVCEFLEKFGGVRWFTEHEVKIPQQKIVTVPDNVSFRRKPAFPVQRHISSTLEHRAYSKSRAYLKLNNVVPYKEWPTLFSARGVGGVHNFWKLTNAVPEGMERMLPVNGKGEPQRGINNYGPNQLCFANPEFRAFAKQEIEKWLAPVKSQNGIFGWIDVSQNDVWDYCQCEGCKELTHKYGAISGGMLEFINDIASAFPDTIIQTFAYQFTQQPPQNIQARDNVMIQTAFLSSSDLLRPISHPNNAEIRRQYDGWRNIAKQKSVWAYHRLYHMTEAFPWPQCCFWNIAENLRYYHDYGAVKLYIESEYREGRGGFVSRAFNDLHNYLECKLMDDPFQDDKLLIEEFFQYQYGPAVDEMKAYAAYLKKRIDAVQGKVSDKPLKTRGIMDEAFFVTVNGLFAKAEEKAGNDSGLLTRIAMERIPVDYAAFEMWKQGGSACGVAKDALVNRLEKNVKLFFDRYHPEKQRKFGNKSLEEWEKETFDMLNVMRHPLPVPPGFEDKDIIQVPVYGTCHEKRVLVNDPDATLGTAMKLGKVADPKYDHTKYPMLFGIYDYTTNTSLLERTIPKEEIPQDEKTYRLYYIGRIAPNGFHKERLYGHRSWALRIHELYAKLWDPMDDKREYDIYISCKLTGPAYVEGSTQENAVYVDKLLAVKCRNEK